MENEERKDDLTTSDGRKIVSFSAAGESYTIESTGAAIDAEKKAFELELMKRRAGYNPFRHWDGNDRSARR